MVTRENCGEITRRGVAPHWELTAGAVSCAECERERSRGNSRPAHVPAPVLCCRCGVSLCLLHGWKHATAAPPLPGPQQFDGLGAGAD